MALDILAIPPMSDEIERIFSSAKLLLTDRRSRLKMDIIEANECLRSWYGRPKEGSFDSVGPEVSSEDLAEEGKEGTDEGGDIVEV
jgi:hypothetical protein